MDILQSAATPGSGDQGTLSAYDLVFVEKLHRIMQACTIQWFAVCVQIYGATSPEMLPHFYSFDPIVQEYFDDTFGMNGKLSVD